MIQISLLFLAVRAKYLSSGEISILSRSVKYFYSFFWSVSNLISILFLILFNIFYSDSLKQAWSSNEYGY